MALVHPDATLGTIRKRQGRGLRTSVPASAPPSLGLVSAPRGYSDQQREDLGYRILAAVLAQLGGRKLTDFRRLRGIGADALDELRRAVELKACPARRPSRRDHAGMA